jgi:hypothetical protein
MANECTTTLRLIKLKYRGDELESYLKAWEVFTTLVTDCPQERRLKEKLRKERAAKLMKAKRESVNL